MSNQYDKLRRELDSSINRINESLPKKFTSSDFIQVVKDSFPNEYAEILQSSSYRALHTWIARWYLNRQKDYEQIGDTTIVTRMGSRSSQKLWKKS